MSYPTSRRYARSLREAFPNDPREACPIEHYRKPFIARMADYLSVLLVGSCAGAGIALAIRFLTPAGV